jgi:conjugative transposon TraN protein
MKKICFIFAIFLASLHSYAQDVKKSQLPVVYLAPNVSLQFVSPEPIQYVDISVKSLTGDLPLKNVLRLRLKDSVKYADAVVTMAGEKFIAQYHIIQADSITARDARTQINIDPAVMRPLDISGIGLSQAQFKYLALGLFCKKPGRPIEHIEAFDLEASVYRLYAAGDYIFIDLGYRNKTNLNYNIEDLRFHVDDKKISKATNVQSIELKPEFILFNNPQFQKNYRNIIVLRKLSFPGNKVLRIELSEKQISGRVITMSINYQHVLDADVLPLK